MKTHILAAVLVGSLTVGSVAMTAPTQAGAKAKSHHPVKKKASKSSKKPHKSTTTTTAKARKASSGIGDQQMVLSESGQYETVLLNSVINPAQLGGGLVNPAGDYFVGIDISVRNDSAGVAQGDADLNLSVIGSDDQVYTPTVYPITGCTDFDGGGFNLSQGAAETGCVTFELPSGVSVAKVIYAPDGSGSLHQVSWKPSLP